MSAWDVYEFDKDQNMNYAGNIISFNQLNPLMLQY